MKKKTGNALVIVLIILFACSLLITTQLSKLMIQQKLNVFFHNAISHQ